MGQLRAVNVLLFGKKLTAHDALEYGLLSKVVQHDELFKATGKMLENFSHFSPESLRVNKSLLRDIHRDALTKANAEECRTIIDRWESKDFAEAFVSFLAHPRQSK